LLAALSVRVETDWFAFDSEFRYVLQPGDSIAIQSTTPIGQAFFVPREPVTLRKGTEEEQAQFQATVEAFRKDKAQDQVELPTGLKSSPVYGRRMKGRY
jgi:hypothetical protein